MTEETSPSPSWRKIIKGVLPVACVAALLHLAQSKDLLSGFTKPFVTGALNIIGVAAQDHGEHITVGRLEVPWTRDCAGLNLLLILLALTLWVNRSEPFGARFWLRMAITIPSALVANVARVLSLIAYREVAYPNVESPQLHYFLGLAWLLPFVAMIVPRNGRPFGHVMFEALHAASVVALLAPMSGVPGGGTMTLAAVICLTQCRVKSGNRYWLTFGTTLWMLAAVAITMVGMESLWMPWLLICPVLVPLKWMFSFCGAVMIGASHPLFGMIPGGHYLAWAAMGIAGWQWINPPASEEAEETSAPSSLMPSSFRLCISAACFVLPFLASTFLLVRDELQEPPVGVRSRPVPGNGFEVALPDQPGNLGLVWYSPQGNSRHHTVKVCLKYRGIEITPVEECPGVYTDGKHWLREFFLHDKALLPGYLEYVKDTFRPWTSPGVHLIFITPSTEMTPVAFNEAATKHADELHKMCSLPLPVEKLPAPELLADSQGASVAAIKQ